MDSYHHILHVFMTVVIASVIYLYLEASQKLTELENALSEKNRSIEHGVREAVSTEERQNYVDTLLLEGSSVWCVGGTHTERLCHFKNLCYSPHHERFVFFHSKHSLIDGATQEGPALLDMSAVEDHNTQYFNYDDFPVAAAGQFNISVIEEHCLIMNRFKPDNLMHIFHDDLLPLYHTLRTISHFNMAAMERIRLVFMEGRDAGEFQYIYDKITNHKPLLKMDFQNSLQDNLVCFQAATVGISKQTTWYQYGFKEPQGPLPHVEINALEITQFTAFMKRRLGISDGPLSEKIIEKQTYGADSDKTSSEEQYIKQSDQQNIIVIFSRKQNRLILNEVELSLSLAEKFNMQVISVSMETHTLSEMIVVVSRAKIAVGIHGSLLILSMFLPPQSVLVELFPFAINPDNYTPYKTLANLKGMKITYKAWRNTYINNTVTHPDYPEDLGGIWHLSKEKQQEILTSSEVAPHLCCSDPEWLFRIYQDTVVDVPVIVELIKTSLEAHGAVENIDDLNEDRILPAQVEKLACLPFEESTNGKAGLWLSWQPPWNIQFFDPREIEYEVWIQEKGSEDYAAYKMKKRSHQFRDKIKPQTMYYIWVRCIFDHTKVGPMNSAVVSCQTTG
ncbi:protein O-linked-mannose beta-1,4-N-acetylglucosaminyltransferase 2-like [Lingula anatina]|uniref:Protein O-linked-mannose beta-1,4-N-acetylglucosaminyltransferase 2-like n=1 Tax=Lingula anatina TaxID=7574 RepID=A0A1S3HC13_LINAN|nr:protein O-linked-mannose beta-1,4-N-acetylglucosaminyltransferase 2-like [Lingula anatina]|eukprot:XP_013383567.1 protein O-linked-mannose beta-1,4-N-acetylglucosaminyltransferase 2-like [Lingula anatina]